MSRGSKILFVAGDQNGNSRNHDYFDRTRSAVGFVENANLFKHIGGDEVIWLTERLGLCYI